MKRAVASSWPLLALVACIAGNPERTGIGTRSMNDVRAFLNIPGAHEPFVPARPLGIRTNLTHLVPASNPITVAKLDLGRQLFFDPRLSRDATTSCATCHDPAQGWAGEKSVPIGVGERTLIRNPPSIVNRILGRLQAWDGRTSSLEAQSVHSIEDQSTMGLPLDQAALRLGGIAGYQVQFEAVFGGEVTGERIGLALGAFQRALLSGANKNDYFERALAYAGFDIAKGSDPVLVRKVERVRAKADRNLMGESAVRGRELFFGRAGCSVCHVGENLTDELFHNVGAGFPNDAPDLGRFYFSGDAVDRGAFKTPSLRNVTLTAPYMHDGSLSTLRAVVDHYDRGGNRNAQLSEKLSPLGLSDAEKESLVAFLAEALLGALPVVEIPKLP